MEKYFLMIAQREFNPKTGKYEFTGELKYLDLIKTKTLNDMIRICKIGLKEKYYCITEKTNNMWFREKIVYKSPELVNYEVKQLTKYLKNNKEVKKYKVEKMKNKIIVEINDKKIEISKMKRIYEQIAIIERELRKVKNLNEV